MRTHKENCACDTTKMKKAVESAYKRVGCAVQDKDKNFLYTLDSFGFRGQLPGETAECYEVWKKYYFECVALGEDD